MKRLLILGIVIAVAGYAGQASAGFYFGDETKGVTLVSNESDLNLRVRLQPRIDAGEIIKNEAGTEYRGATDMYLRRVRLEMSGHLLTKTVKYSLVIEADKWDKAGNANKVGVQYANAEWLASDAVNVLFGKQKLPYSRVSLTSSSKQLIVERPVSTEAAKKLFGPSDAYYQPKAAVYGKLAEGAFAYEVAVADGWQNNETIQTGRTAQKADPFIGVRVELSPPGWVEKSKSDAHLGAGRHLTLGGSYATQTGIVYKENAFEEDRTLWGLDLSGHYLGLTGQFEYNEWKEDSSDPSIGEKKPRGWYAQAGYFIDGLAIEPVARYESYDQDSTKSDREEKVTTIGVNWYGKGHSLKVGLNWAHTEYGGSASGKLANDDKKDVYQLQAQMYF